MNFTDLVIKFNSGDPLTDDELNKLHVDSTQITDALKGKGMIAHTLCLEAIRIQCRVADIIEARSGRSISAQQAVGRALRSTTANETSIDNYHDSVE